LDGDIQDLDADIQDLDSEIEPASEAAYNMTPGSTARPRVTHEGAFAMASSPATPSAGPRSTHDIAALTDLVRAMIRTNGNSPLEALMHLDDEELEGEDLGHEELDLDAEIEDMDDEEEEGSFIEGDSMEL
jgi:hypothetical protein